MDVQLDSHFIGLLEQKLEKTRIVRVDSDVIDNLIVKENKKEANLSATERTILTTAFSSQTPNIEKAQFLVSFEALTADDLPIIITQNEFMRRMKDMAAMQPGMNFYGELPDSYNLVVNTENPLVTKVRTDASSKLDETVKPLIKKIDDANAEISALRGDGKKEIDAETQQKIKDLEKEVADTRGEQEIVISNYAKGNDLIKQLIDLALLGNGLLRGEDLSKFIARSVSLLK
jgi:molecular chaperone HtpG